MMMILKEKQNVASFRKRKRTHHAKVDASCSLDLSQLLKGDVSCDLF